MRVPGQIILGAILFLCACRTGRSDDVDTETSFRDDRLVCRRVHAVIDSQDQGFLDFELPAVAEIVQRTVARSGVVRDCGAELVAWLCSQLAVRPIDLRPRLAARVLALGPFLASDDSWRKSALDSLDGILMDEGTVVLHFREEFTYPGPGSQKISTGWTQIVSRDDLDRWVVSALIRGNTSVGPSYSWLGAPQRARRDDYADLMVRFFAARWTEPQAGASGVLHRQLLPLRQQKPFHSPPPKAAKLGCGVTSFDRLWSDLLLGYRSQPEHPRWDRLPAEVRRQLSAAPTDC